MEVSTFEVGPIQKEMIKLSIQSCPRVNLKGVMLKFDEAGSPIMSPREFDS